MTTIDWWLWKCWWWWFVCDTIRSSCTKMLYIGSVPWMMVTMTMTMMIVAAIVD
jgi:hypothetical protein